MNIQKPTLPTWNGADNTYPHLLDASNEMLAWQFLRRNPTYQKLCVEEFQSYPNHRNTELGTELTDILLHDMGMDRSDPHNPIIDQFVPWAIKSKHTKIGEKAFLEEFGAFLLIRPEIEDPPLIELKNYFVQPRLIGDIVGGFWNTRKTITATDVPGSVVAYLFDLSRDLSPQLASAKQELEETQKMGSPLPEYIFKKKKGPSAPWQRYIWLLDAQETGYSEPEMRVQLYGKGNHVDRNNSREDTIKDQLEKANKLRDGGYKDLLR